MKITAINEYAGLIPGNDYTLVKEGRDYNQIKVKGQSQVVPKWVFEGKLHRKYQKEETEEYEDFMLGNDGF